VQSYVFCGAAVSNCVHLQLTRTLQGFRFPEKNYINGETVGSRNREKQRNSGLKSTHVFVYLFIRSAEVTLRNFFRVAYK